MILKVYLKGRPLLWLCYLCPAWSQERQLLMSKKNNNRNNSKAETKVKKKISRDWISWEIFWTKMWEASWFCPCWFVLVDCHSLAMVMLRLCLILNQYSKCPFQVGIYPVLSGLSVAPSATLPETPDNNLVNIHSLYHKLLKIDQLFSSSHM